MSKVEKFKKDSLAARMKSYEESSKTKLVPRMPVVIRIDGRAHHTFTKGLNKPFDKIYYKCIKSTMKALFMQVSNCVFGYCQSDEITLVLYPKGLETMTWFDNEVQKLTSVCASIATVEFNREFRNQVDKVFKSGRNISDKLSKAYTIKSEYGATFDARAFNVPKEDVPNNILWRVKDCHVNSISAIARSLFSAKQLHGKNREQQLQMIEEQGVNIHDNYEDGMLYGNYCLRKEYNVKVEQFHLDMMNYESIENLIDLDQYDE